MEDIIKIVKEIGLPTALAIWLMFRYSTDLGKLQRLVEWAITLNAKVDRIIVAVNADYSSHNDPPNDIRRKRS